MSSIRRILPVGLVVALVGCGSSRDHTPPAGIPGVSNGPASSPVAPGPSDAPLRPIDFALLQSRPLSDAAIGAAVARELRFVVDSTVSVESLGAPGSPEPQRPVLIVTGRLQNPTAAEHSVQLFPVGTFAAGPARDTPFIAALQASPAFTDTSPALPPEPPQRVEVTIPPRSEIVFRTVIDTLHLRYTGSPSVQIGWTFHFWRPNPNPTGTLSVQLPPRP